MTPSPANEDNQGRKLAGNSPNKQRKPVDQANLETPADLRDETAANLVAQSRDDLPESLAGEEREQAQAALAFLNEVKSATRASQQLPESIGRYSILRSLGRGGFAEVFLAEDRELDRNVALKVPLFDSALNESGRQRFEREAKLAASLGHPDIVPVYEYGELGPLRFIAFGWCDGPTLGKWIEDNGPLDFDTVARIGESLARAVQHAHQRGIIHRDLKPGNVLVDSSEDSKDRPIWERLRITDFGLARNYESHDHTLTQDGQLVGTPAYMAPEQAGSGAEVGPASDVWGVGMILFEMLTGQLPFRKPEIMASLRAIVDDPIPKANKLRRDLPDALCAIVDCCLRKEPGDRYASAHELAEDLSRFSNGQAVKAKPPTTVTKLKLWVRRNPAIAAVGSIAFLFLTLGLAGTTWQYLRAADNLEIAETALQEEKKARVKAQKVASLFTKTYRRTKPGSDGRELKVIEMLERTASEIKVEFVEDDQSRWELLYELALTYDGLGVHETAVEILQEVYDEQLDSEFRESRMTLQAVVALQRSLHSMGKFDLSKQKAKEGRELGQRLSVEGKLAGKILEAEGLCLEHESKFEEAVVCFEQAIVAYESDDDYELADSLSAYTLVASTQRMLGEFEKVATRIEPIVEEALANYGSERPEVITLLQEYASVLVKLERYETAIEILEQQLEICNEVMGPLHGRTLQIKGNLASTLTFVGRRDEAIVIYREVVEASEASHGPDNPNTAVSRYLLGSQLVKVGQFDEAQTNLQKAYEVLLPLAGIDNPWTSKAQMALVWLWFRIEKWEESTEHFLVRAKLYDESKNAQALSRAAVARIEAGQTMIRMGKLAEGVDLIAANLARLEENEQAALAIRYHSSIVSALVDHSDFEQAVPFAESYLASTPVGYQHVQDIISSRVLAAVVGVKLETPSLVEKLADVELAEADKLNTEQWLLLSGGLKALKSELDNENEHCLAHQDLIDSLFEMCQEAIVIPGG